VAPEKGRQIIEGQLL